MNFTLRLVFLFITSGVLNAELHDPFFLELKCDSDCLDNNTYCYVGEDAMSPLFFFRPLLKKKLEALIADARAQQKMILSNTYSLLTKKIHMKIVGRYFWVYEKFHSSKESFDGVLGISDQAIDFHWQQLTRDEIMVNKYSPFIALKLDDSWTWQFFSPTTEQKERLRKLLKGNTEKFHILPSALEIDSPYRTVFSADDVIKPMCELN